MKVLSSYDFNLISGGATVDQKLGQGFVFGSVVGLCAGAAARYTATQTLAQAGLGGLIGVGVGGFAGAVFGVPFATYFTQEASPIVEEIFYDEDLV